MAYEVVLLAPVLVLVTLFVLWAGRGGSVALTADLAAEEAAAAAALCCEDDDPATPGDIEGEDERETVTEEVLLSRPGLDMLCVGGIRPDAGNPPPGGPDDGFVLESWLQFGARTDGPQPSTSGLGVLEVGFECETDGAVAPLRGLFPTVSFSGRAAEVVLTEPDPIGVGFKPPLAVPDTGKGETFEEGDTFTVTISAVASVASDVEVYFAVATASTATADDDCSDDNTDGDYCTGVVVGGNPELDDLLTVPPAVEPYRAIIAAGDIETSFDIPTVTGGGHEGLETLVLEITRVAGAGVQVDDSRDTWEGTIEDDTPLPYVMLECGGPTAVEGAPLHFTVRLRDLNDTDDAPASEDIDVIVNTDDGAGSATAGVDYASWAASGLTIPAGDIELRIPMHFGGPRFTVDTLDEDPPEVESDETVVVTVTEDPANPWQDLMDRGLFGGFTSPPSSSCRAGTHGTIKDDESIVTIRDADPEGPPEQPQPDTLAEAGEGDMVKMAKFDVLVKPAVPGGAVHTEMVQVRLTRKDPPSSLTKATVGTACSGGADYRNVITASDGNTGIDTIVLDFPVGTDELSVTVDICDDAVTEPDEFFDVEVSVESGPAAVDPDGGDPYGGRGKIVDDDTPWLFVGDANAREFDDLTTPLDDSVMEFTVELVTGDPNSPDTRTPAMLTEDVTVDWKTVNGTADGDAACAMGIDFEHDSGTFTGTDAFKASDPPVAAVAKTVTVQICDDLVIDPDETLLVQFHNPNVAGLFDGDPALPEPPSLEATGTITDGGVPAIEVDSPVRAAEGDELTFTVRLIDGRPGETYTVDYRLQNRTTQFPGDYGQCAAPDDHSFTGRFTLSRTTPTDTLCVLTLRDKVVENDEQVWLWLSNPVRAKLDPRIGVGIIEDRSPVVVYVGDAAVAEGDTASFPVSLLDRDGQPYLADPTKSASTTNPLQLPAVSRIDLSARTVGTGESVAAAWGPLCRSSRATATHGADGDADADFEGFPSGKTLSFADGAESHQQSLTADTHADARDETDETFAVCVKVDDPPASSSTWVYGDRLGVATVIDAEVPTLRVCREFEDKGNDVAVCPNGADWETPEGADLEFEVRLGVYTVDRNSGRRVWVERPALGDIEFDIAVAGGTACHDGRHRPDDSDCSDAGDNDIEPNDARDIVVPPRSLRQIPSDLSVEQQAAYVAPSPSHSRTADGMRVVVPAGKTRVRYAIPTRNDQATEPPETVLVQISRPAGIAIDRAVAQGVIGPTLNCIKRVGDQWFYYDRYGNEVGPAVPPSLQVTDAAVAEGSTGGPFIEFSNEICTRSFGDPLLPASIEMSAVFDMSGTAECADLRVGTQGCPPELTKTLGVNTATNVTRPVKTGTDWRTGLYLEALADGIDEDDETYTVSFNWKATPLAGEADIMAVPATATVTILDGDDPPLLSLGDAGAPEGEAVEFEAVLSEASAKTVTFEYRTLAFAAGDGKATAGDDYDDAYENTRWTQASIAPGDTSVTLSVDALADADDTEADETFRLELRAPTGATPPPINATLADRIAIGTITAGAAIEVSVADPDAPADEGDLLIFRVSLSEPAPAGGLEVDWRTEALPAGDGVATPGAAQDTPGADYVTVPRTTLTFAEGEDAKNVEVVTVADSDDAELDERLAVELDDARLGDASKTNAAVRLGDRTAIGIIKGIDCYAPPAPPDGAEFSEGFDYGELLPPRTVSDAPSVSEDADAAAMRFTLEAGRPFCERQWFHLRPVRLDPSFAEPADSGTTWGTPNDYGFGHRTFEWAPSARQASVAVQIFSDELAEGDEKVHIDLIAQDRRPNAPRSSSHGFRNAIGHTRRLAKGSPDSNCSGDTCWKYRLTRYISHTLEGVIEDDDAALVSVAEASVPEGGSLTFAVSLDHPVDAEVTVDYEIRPRASDPRGPDWLATPAALSSAQPQRLKTCFEDSRDGGDGDYSTGAMTPPGQTGTLTIPLRQPGATLVVPTCEDADYERDEVFEIEISNAAGGANLDTDCDDGDCHLAAGIIVNDDPPPVLRIADAAGDEGSVLGFALTLDRPSALDASVTLSTVADGIHQATAPDDYAAVQGLTATFPAGQTDRCRLSGTSATADPPPLCVVDVAALTDDRIEPSETFRLEATALSGLALASPPRIGAMGIGTIHDATARRIAVNDAHADEGDELRFVVEYADAGAVTADDDLVIRYQTLSDDTSVAPATAGVDYAAVYDRSNSPPTIGEVRIRAGQRSATVVVQTVQDRLDERSERLRLELIETGSAGVTFADASAYGLIIDDDPPPAVSIGDADAPENSADPMSFAVELSAVSGRAVLVDYETVDRTAAAGSDFVAASGTVEIAAGSRSAAVEIDLIDDSDAETTEQFWVRLSAPRGARLDDGLGVGLIRDDDGEPELVIDDPAPTAENAPTVAFAVRLTKTSTEQITVNYATAPTTGATAATAGDDYTAASGTLSFAPGDDAATVEIGLIDDNITEPLETFRLVLSNPVKAQLGPDPADAWATASIIDDESLPEISVADAGQTIEGGNAVFRISLNRAAAGQVTVDYATAADVTAAAERAAAAGQDYTITSGTLRLAAGLRHADVTVPLIDDRLDEHTETFWLRLTDPAGAQVDDGTATGTVLDNDPLPALSVSDETVTEGDAGQLSVLTFSVELDHASGRGVEVGYLTAPHGPPGERAEPSVDYHDASGTLSFPPGTTTQTVEVFVEGDDVDEADEMLQLRLSTPMDAVTADGIGIGVIADDDGGPRISVADIRLDEDDGPATFEVTLSAPSAKTVSVDYATRDVTAWAGCDYAGSPERLIDDFDATCGGNVPPGSDQGVSGTLVLPPSVTRGEVSVYLADDDFLESTETFEIVLSNARNAVIAAGGGTAAATIDDDDQVIVNLQPAAGYERHGGLRFRVELDRASSAEVTVQYATFDGSATAPDDYVAAAGELTIPAHSTVGYIDVELTDDNRHERTEEFSLVISDPVGANLGGFRTLGTILDDDSLPRVTVAQVQESYIESDRAAEFSARLDKPSNEDITLRITTANRHGIHTWGNSAYSQRTSCQEDPPLEDCLFRRHEHWPDGYPDYQVTDDTVTIPAGDTEVSFEVLLQDDAWREPEAMKFNGRIRFFVNVHNRSIQHVLPRRSWAYQLAVHVVDDEATVGVGILGNTIVAYEADGQARIPLHLTHGNHNGFTVSLQTRAATLGAFSAGKLEGIDNVVEHLADASADYTSGSVTVQVAAGQTAATAVVDIADDDDMEPLEWFEVAVVPGTGYALTPGNLRRDNTAIKRDAKVAIVDDDTPVEISAAPLTVSESAGTARVAVSLSKLASAEVTVDFLTLSPALDDGTIATAGDDYVTAAGTLTIPKGSRQGFIEVVIVDDNLTESDETFELVLEQPSANARLGAADRATVTIVDDDADLPTFELVHPRLFVDEYDGFPGIQARLRGWDRTSTIKLQARPYEIQSAIDAQSGAVEGEDFVGQWLPWYIQIEACEYDFDGDGDDEPGTQTVASGGAPYPNGRTQSNPRCARQWVEGPDAEIVLPQGPVWLIDDEIPEPVEHYTVVFYEPENVVLASTALAVTIADDDQPVLRIDDVSVDEDAGNAVFTLSLDAAGHEGSNVSWATAPWRSASGSAATPDQDYQHSVGTVTFGATQTQATVSVPILDDGGDEFDETFLLRLSSPVGLIIDDFAAVATIVDDDPGWWVSADPSATESADGTLSFVVQRDHTATSEFTLTYQVDTEVGTATAGESCAAGVDYVLPPGSVAVPAGATEARIDIALCDDSVAEQRETLVIELTDVDGRDLVGVGTIIDDD